MSALIKGLVTVANAVPPNQIDALVKGANKIPVEKAIDVAKPLTAIGIPADIIAKSPFLKYIDETPGMFKQIVDYADNFSKMTPQHVADFLLKHPDLLLSFLKSKTSEFTVRTIAIMEKAPNFIQKMAKNSDNVDDLALVVARNKNASPDVLARAADAAPGIDPATGAGKLSASADDTLRLSDDAFKAGVLRVYPDLDPQYVDKIAAAVKNLPPLEAQKIKNVVRKAIQDSKGLSDVDAKILNDFIAKIEPGGMGALIKKWATSATDAVRQATWKQIILWGIALGLGGYFIHLMVTKSNYRGTITEIKYDVKTWEKDGVFLKHEPGMDINGKDEINVSESKVATIGGLYPPKRVIGPTQYVIRTDVSSWPGDCTTSPCGAISIRPNFFATIGEAVGDAAAGAATAAATAATSLFDALLQGLGLGGMGWIKWVCLALIILSSASVTIGIAMKLM
jgi:hypothetical protein